MAKPIERAVVVLHGLFETGEDPFGYLREVEGNLIRAGFSSIRFDWSETYSPRSAARAIAKADLSFFGELAQHLDRFLRTEVVPRVQDQKWIILAHSAGGGILYRWLVDFGSQFFQQTQIHPADIFAITAPYTWSENQRLQLGKHSELPVRGEKNLDARQLVSLAPAGLTLIIAENDTVLLPDNTDFPTHILEPERVDQYLIPQADHNGVCADSLTWDVIVFRLRRAGLWIE